MLNPNPVPNIDANTSTTKTLTLDLNIERMVIAGDYDIVIIRVNGKTLRTLNYSQAYRMGLIEWL